MAEDNVIAFAAVVIAAMALFVSVYASYLNREHFRLTVTPKLDFDVSYGTPECPMGISLHSTGLGPAKITRVKILVDKKTVEPCGDHIFTKALRIIEFPLDPISLHFFDPGDFLPPNTKFPVLTIDDPAEQDALLQDFKRFLARIDIHVYYTCVYDLPSRRVCLSE